MLALLKKKWIHMHRSRSQDDVIEIAKTKLFAAYEATRRRQSERYVLRKEMVDHAIPCLFVSPQNDEDHNGFNCAICQKKVSFIDGASLRFSAISGVYDTSSEFVVTRVTCTPPTMTRCQCHRSRLSCEPKLKRLQLLSRGRRITSLRMKLMRWPAPSRVFHPLLLLAAYLIC